jgi:transposase
MHWTQANKLVKQLSWKASWANSGLANLTFELSLQHFAKQLNLGSNRKVILLIDGAGFHRSKNLKIPDGIHLHCLPPYSPELQPVEQLWPFSHECHANKKFETIEDLEETLSKRCMWLTENKEIVTGITNFHWWPL